MGKWLARFRPDMTSDRPDVPDNVATTPGTSAADSSSGAEPQPKRLPTRLEHLIDQVANHYGCSSGEVEEIRQAALRDIPAALDSFRAMRAMLPPELKVDDCP